MEESFRWWEKKRLIYNLIAVFGGLLVFFLRSGVPNGRSPNEFYQIHPYLFLGIMLFGANIFYGLTNTDTENTKQGIIEITAVNNTTKIIKGTFEFTTVNNIDYPNDPVNYNVTDGTFNYKYE